MSVSGTIVHLGYCMDEVIRRVRPGFVKIDTARVRYVETKHGKFHYTRALQKYYNVFEQVDEYKVDDLKSDDIVFDIGANLGVFTSLVANRVKHIVAVEPLFFNELMENIELNGLDNVTCLPYALGGPAESEETGHINFNGKSQEVKYKTLGAIIKASGMKPTFLKTDCEGGEWGLTAKDLDGIRAVEAEVHTFGGKNPQDFVKMLEVEGFTVTYDVTPEGMIQLHARRTL